MSTQGDPPSTRVSKLTRTSILVPVETDQALRELAEKGERPLSWEIRRALEAHVERETQKAVA